MALTAGISAVGGAATSYFNAGAQKSALQTQASLADINAQQSELAAQQEEARGNAQVGQITARAGQVKGAQRAALAANGVDLGVGSAAEVLTSTDIVKSEDVNQATVNAVNAAWGYRKQETDYRNQAGAERASASGISQFGAAATSLLGSATTFATSYYAGKKAGG